MPYRPGSFQGPWDTFTLLKVVLLGAAFCGFLTLLGSHPDLFTVTVVFLSLLAVLAIAHVVLTVLRVQYANRWGPTRSRPAVVSRKWTQQSDLSLPGGGALEQSVADPLDQDINPTVYQRYAFWVSFDLGQGEEEEFLVPETLYAELEEGRRGVLTYRGERVLSFLPADNPPGPADAGPSHWRPGPRLPRS